MRESREKMRIIMTQPLEVVNEWMVFMNGISLMILYGVPRVGAAINYYKFMLTVGILLTPPNMLKYWMYSFVHDLGPILHHRLLTDQCHAWPGNGHH